MKNKIFIALILSLAFTSAHAGTNAAATAGQAMQVVLAGANAIQTKVYVTECTKQVYTSCGLAVMYGAQTLLMIATAKQSGNTKEDSACTGSYCGGNLPGGLDGNVNLTPGTANTDGMLDNLQDTVNGQLTTLASRGYTYDSESNSIKTPNGDISLASASTADGMKSAFGLSDADLAKLDDVSKQALKEASQKYGGEGFDIGGGGGRKKGGRGGDENFDMNKYLAGLMNNDLGAKSRGVAGLEKKYGTDQIGIAQDNIFQMIHRRYEAKQPSLNP